MSAELVAFYSYSYFKLRTSPKYCSMLKLTKERLIKSKKKTRAHLDGVDECHEAQAAEVDIKGVAKRPEQIVPGRILPRVAHVHHGGSSRLAGGFAVCERGAIRWKVIGMIIHDNFFFEDL